MRARLVNASGQIKEVKVGYSWTTFFFGFFVPLVRMDMRNFFIQMVIAVAFGAANFVLPGIAAVAQMIYNIFYFASQYNKMYTKTLVNKGYKAATDTDAQVLNSKGYPTGGKSEGGVG